jgi:hypothetical protein
MGLSHLGEVNNINQFIRTNDLTTSLPVFILLNAVAISGVKAGMGLTAEH